MDNYSYKNDYKTPPEAGLFLGIGLGIMSLIISPITLIVCALLAVLVYDITGFTWDVVAWLFFLAGMMYDAHRKDTLKNK